MIISVLNLECFLSLLGCLAGPFQSWLIDRIGCSITRGGPLGDVQGLLVFGNCIIFLFQAKGKVLCSCLRGWYRAERLGVWTSLGNVWSHRIGSAGWFSGSPESEGIKRPLQPWDFPPSQMKGLESAISRLTEIGQALETACSRHLHFTRQEGEAQTGHKNCPTSGHMASGRGLLIPVFLNPELGFSLGGGGEEHAAQYSDSTVYDMQLFMDSRV